MYVAVFTASPQSWYDSFVSTSIHLVNSNKDLFLRFAIPGV